MAFFPFSGSPKLSGEAAVDFADLAAGAQASKDVTIAGLKTSDIVHINFPSWPTASTISIMRWRVKAANTLEITIRNHHASDAENMASQTMKYIVF